MVMPLLLAGDGNNTHPLWSNHHSNKLLWKVRLPSNQSLLSVNTKSWLQNLETEPFQRRNYTFDDNGSILIANPDAGSYFDKWMGMTLFLIIVFGRTHMSPYLSPDHSNSLTANLNNLITKLQ